MQILQKKDNDFSKLAELRCSFCRKKQYQPKRLIAGPTVYLQRMRRPVQPDHPRAGAWRTQKRSSVSVVSQQASRWPIHPLSAHCAIRFFRPAGGWYPNVASYALTAWMQLARRSRRWKCANGMSTDSLKNGG